MRNYYRVFYKQLFILFGCCSFCINTQAQNWDINLLKSINPDNPGSKVWRTTSASAYVFGLGVPAGLLLAGKLSGNKEQRLNAYKVIGTIFISTILTEGLKSVIRRDRPFGRYPNDIHPYKSTNDHRSMPSGHTSLAFSTAAGLAITYKKWYITVPAYAWATGVGYSRIYLGAHYPSDVIAGAAVGIGSSYLSVWLNNKLFHTKAVKHQDE